MWILFGTTAKTKRVPGGARVERTCGNCGETAMFYERDTSTTFQLYTVDLFDYGHRRVMACGACGAHYATDEVDAPSTMATKALHAQGSGLLAAGQRAAEGVGGLIGRAADVVEARVSSLLDGDTREAAPADGSPLRSPARAHVRDADLSDDDRDALEARFRELEASQMGSPEGGFPKPLRASSSGAADGKKARFKG